MFLQDLFESVSSIVYHFTSLPNAAEILKNNYFRLTASSGTKTERDLANGKEYYFSTTRSRVGDYTLHQFHKSGLVFELNGDWFNQRYKGSPVDYWGRPRGEGPGLKGRYKEMEDRVFSDEPYIPFPKDPKNLIKSIHILWQMKPSETDLNQSLRTIMIRAKQLGIPHYIYNDEHAFVLQDTRRSVQVDTSKLTNPQAAKFGDNWPRTEKDWFKGYREVYYAKDKDSLSKEGKRVADTIMYYRDDAIRSLDANIHNEKRKASTGLVKLLKIFQTLKINSSQGFVDAMSKKWKPLYADAEEKYWAEIKKKREEEEAAKSGS
jgi:hypothetical protein